MIGFWKSLNGMYEVELTSGAPEERLWEISEQGIPVCRVERVSELCVRFLVNRKDMKKVEIICKHRGDTMSVRRRRGIYWRFFAAAKRPVLMVEIYGLLLLSLLLPTRVLFFSVEGNERIPQNRILEEASNCGLGFGVSRRSVRSEQVKNELLHRIPDLKWAGVNTWGCVAHITVREESVEEPQEATHTVSNVVALRDGLVLDCTATRGTLRCKPGELVRQGQILISGYTDCGRIIQATNAEGEIYAGTVRNVRVLRLLNHQTSEKKLEEYIRCSILLGKKRINLWKDSGIWDATYDRMYREYVLTLPGGFQLPVAWCVETVTKRSLSETDGNGEDVSQQLRSYAEEYLLNHMNSGQILTGNYRLAQDHGVAILEGEYHCREMIGRTQPEQMGEEHGKTD